MSFEVDLNDVTVECCITVASLIPFVVEYIRYSVFNTCEASLRTIQDALLTVHAKN